MKHDDLISTHQTMIYATEGPSIAQTQGLWTQLAWPLRVHTLLIIKVDHSLVIGLYIKSTFELWWGTHICSESKVKISQHKLALLDPGIKQGSKLHVLWPTRHGNSLRNEASRINTAPFKTHQKINSLKLGFKITQNGSCFIDLQIEESTF